MPTRLGDRALSPLRVDAEGPFAVRIKGSKRLHGSSVKIGTKRRRLAWPLRKDDTNTHTHTHREVLTI